MRPDLRSVLHLQVSPLDVGLWRQPHLQRVLGPCISVLPRGGRPGEVAHIGWGMRPSGARAAARAAATGQACWRLEDGFLRSVGLGRRAPAWSVLIDDVGIYYCADQPSRLEALVSMPVSAEQADRAASIAACWRQLRLSKYNHAREAVPPVSGPYVLAVDQTFGDASVRHGMADGRSFERMLEAALDEYPSVPVVLKVHPDVISGRKRGHFERGLTSAAAARVILMAQDVHPPSLIEPALAVYTVTSQMGFEGLLWGKRVRTFGMPFYAGWGLTHDELPLPSRRRVEHRVTLNDLVHAALVDYPRYVDPETLERCEPERLMEWMGLQRRMRERFPRQVYGVGFSRWKKPIVRAFMAGSEVRFVSRATAVPAGASLAVWGCRPVQAGGGVDEPVDPDRARVPVVRLEDGFLRSVGLGADLVRPLSWVMDCRGLYYDATGPSDLENLLQTTAFDAELLQRAQALRQRIVAAGLTKYNVGTGGWTRPRGGRAVVLVPGQVETDASIRLGALGIRTNLELLQAARRAAPDAYLVYKPHPDVVARLRRAGKGEAEARRYCDEVVIDAPIHEVLDAVDELHVLTSLAGFEGLLRGKRVTCHGCPFYAGWGLTEDCVTMPRRGRQLNLDELVAAVLILYPTYVSRTTHAFTTPERALEELLAWRAQGRAAAPVWRRLLRWVLSRRPA